MNPYDILGISKNASKNEIKSRYKELILRHHPDKGGDSDKFFQIHNAYKILNEEEICDDSKETYKYNTLNIIKSFIKDRFLKEYKELYLTLEEMYNGKNIRISLSSYIDCTKCYKTFCHSCNGTGSIKHNLNLLGIKQKIIKECKTCNGFGFQRQCDLCDDGYIMKEKKYILKIKKGCDIDDKYSIENNSVIFIIKPYTHPRFIRHDNDLILYKTISLYESISCHKISCKHLNNKTYTFSANNTIQNDNIYKLNGLGMPIKNSEKYGDLYIKFDILLPNKIDLSEQQKHVIKNVFGIAENNNIDSSENIHYNLHPTNENELDNGLIRRIRSGF